MKKLRILVADDHAVVRAGVRSLLEGQPDCEVCAEAVTGRQALALAKQIKPDVVILDITMPELNGLEATRQILKASPATEVLILTIHESEQLVREILGAGARGYVLKSDAGRNLAAAVEALREHKPFFTSKVADIVLQGYLSSRDAKAEHQAAQEVLTRREREIIQLLAEGKTNKEVAVALDISVKTVETHRSNIMHKLALHSVTDLVHYAIRNEIVNP